MNIVESVLAEEVLVEDYSGVVLTKKDHGMGLEVWYGDSFALAGGMRSGSSPAGTLRRAYSIIDLEKIKSGASQEEATVGVIHMFTGKEGEPVGIVDIKLTTKNRKAGMGSAVVQSLAKTAPDHLVIHDIKQSAIGFWKKMGCEFVNRSGQPVTPRGFKGTLCGVIKKEGSNTPFDQLPGMVKKTFSVATAQQPE